MKKARPTTKADETPEFLAFWDAWRPIMHKNDGRGSARDEFFRHVEVRGADPQDIVDGARWFARNGGNAEYKLHAQTWLNRCAYEDGCEQEREFQRKIAEMQARKPAENIVQFRSSAPEPIDREARARHAAEVMARAGYGPRVEQEQKKQEA